MQGTAAAVTLPPQLDVNPNPTGPHDLLTGSASGFYNSILSAIGLNLTVIGHLDVGSCADLVTSNCTGVRADLQSGVADFALTGMSYQDYDSRVPVPMTVGPFLYDSLLLFGGLAQSGQRVMRGNLLTTLFRIPASVYCLTLLVYLL